MGFTADRAEDAEKIRSGAKEKRHGASCRPIKPEAIQLEARELVHASCLSRAFSILSFGT